MGMSRLISLLVVCVAVGTLLPGIAPIDGTFSYQGRLTNSGAPITGLADVRFSLFDADAAGTQIGSTITSLDTPIAGGLFNVELDFGVAAFDGEQRWLEIEARSPAGVGGYTTLSPRQPLLGAPYAIQTRGLFVDDTLEVGIGTTAPSARLHIGGADPTVIIADGGNATLEFDGTTGKPQRILSLHSSNNGPSAGMQEGPFGGQWQAYSPDLGGFSGLVGTMGSSSAGGAGLLHLYSNETGSLNVMMRADLNKNPDDNESGYLQLGSSGVNGLGGVVGIRNNDAKTTISLVGGATGAGARLGTFDPTTSGEQFLVEPDPSPIGGGTLSVARNDSGAFGLYVDGNYEGTESVNLYLSGTPSPVSFFTDLAGDGSVNLPNDSVGAFEVLDEPGIANDAAFPSGLPNAVDIETEGTVILSRTITCPAPGYCLVIGTSAVSTYHLGSTDSGAFFGLAKSTAQILDFEKFKSDISSLQPGSTYYHSVVTVHGVFEVPAGATTFDFRAQRIGGIMHATDRNLSIVYFPTAYGAIVPQDGGFARHAGPGGRTAYDIQTEQIEAMLFDQQRRDDDFELMQRQLEMVTHRLEQIDAERNRTDLPIGAPRDRAGALVPSTRQQGDQP